MKSSPSIILSGHWLDRVLSMACVGLGIAILIASRAYPVSAAALPQASAWLIGACGIGLLFFPGKVANFQEYSVKRLVVATVIFLGALALFSRIGADVALFGLFLSSAMIMGYPLGFRLLGITALFCAFLGGVFGALLNVPLSGPVFGLLFN